LLKGRRLISEPMPRSQAHIMWPIQVTLPRVLLVFEMTRESLAPGGSTMKPNRLSAFLLGLFVSCMLAGTSFAQQPTDSLPRGTSHPLENQSADRAAWHQRMLALPRPTAGCFAAKYPSEKWEETACGSAPALFHKRRPALTKVPGQPLVKQSAPEEQSVAGDGNDLIATVVGGPITSVEGFFDQAVDVQTVTSVLIKNGTTSDAPGAYSLQINAAPFSTPAACANAKDPSVCQGWLQFLFMNDDNGSFAGMEVWLFDFGPTCPGQGSVPQLPGMPPGLSWSSAGNDCTFYAETPLLSQQPITELGQLRLRADAVTGGQDSVTITLADGSISGIAISDELLNLASVWTQAEFNVLGYVNGERASFKQGAGVVVHVDVENGTANAPNISNGGFTGETNTFDLVPPGCRDGGNPPNIVFEEVTLPNQASQSCPPAAIPPPPPQNQCTLATEGITGLQKQLAAAQAQLTGPTCEGPARFDCEKRAQMDQSELTAAIIHKNQVCNP
jgi:hypothetical protein